MMSLIRKIGFVLSLIVTVSGCGTTKFSDTTRTATEQLLISSAMEDVVDEFNFYPLSGRKIFIKSDGVSATDKEYLLSILRQQLAANGVLIQETKDLADYILEVSTGAIGTDRCELIYGTKETSVPSILTMGVATTIPEFALAKRTDQKAKIKLTMWAYNRKTGAIVWQSGQKNKTAAIRDRWFFGIGPITKSSFNDKTQLGGDDVPFEMSLGERIAKDEKPSVKTEATYRELDHEAIDHLEKIRKEGMEAMSFDLTEDDSMTAFESMGDSRKNDLQDAFKTGTEETGGKAEDSSKKTPSPREPGEGAQPSDGTVKTESAPVPETPPSSPLASSVSENDLASQAVSSATALDPPSNVGESSLHGNKRSLPTLQFDDLTLSIGKTVVPAE